MNKKVLVFTAKTDIHCDKVAMKLREKNYDIIRINTEDIPTNLKYHIKQNGNCSTMSFEIIDSEINFNPDEICSIWYRKPAKANINIEMNKVGLNFIETEQTRLLESIYGLLNEKKWVNPFWANKLASQKLPNHLLASKLGLKTPNTIVTNKFLEIETFCRDNNNSVIIKSFNFGGFSMNDNTSWACFAKKVTIEKLENFKESVNFAPVFLQQYIEKAFELRVTVIGNLLFTAKINSQTNSQSVEDFRAISAYDLEHSIFTLPVKIEKQLLAFNKYYKLEFSTFDLIVTPQNEFFFLECNPNGQWLWIEDLTGLPIANEIANHLIN